MAAERRSAPAGVRLVAALLAIVAVLSLLTAVALLGVGLTGTVTSAGAPAGWPVALAGALEIGLSVVVLVLAWLLTRGSNAARWWVIILGLIRVGAEVVAIVLLPDFRINALIQAVLRLVVVGLLLTPRAADFFTHGHPTE